jgi:hypothetical protein
VPAREPAAAYAKFDLQIGDARRQMTAFLKGLDWRHARRAAEIRNIARVYEPLSLQHISATGWNNSLRHDTEGA